MSGAPEHLPAVRTFKPRRRPLSAGRAELMARLEPQWCLAETDEAAGAPFDPVAIFGRRGPLVIEIGIGLGDSLTDMAAADPGTDVVGCDIHTPGIAATLARIDELGLTNVRLVHGDALAFLERVGAGTVAGLRLYFPDPWPKARHRHRRIVSPRYLERFVEVLAPGGTLHVATDIDDYAAQTVRLCDEHPELHGGVVERPSWRATTRYERKGRAAGRDITDIIYRRG